MKPLKKIKKKLKKEFKKLDMLMEYPWLIEDTIKNDKQLAFMQEVHAFFHYYSSLNLHLDPHPDWSSSPRAGKKGSKVWKWLIDIFYTNSIKPDETTLFPKPLIDMLPKEEIVCDVEHYPEMYK